MSQIKINNLKVNEIKELDIPRPIKAWLQSIDFPEEIIIKFHKMIEYGALKHGRNSWLNPDNKSMEDLANLSSIARHNALGHFSDPIDKESGEYHMWSASIRAGFKAIRQERGIDK